MTSRVKCGILRTFFSGVNLLGISVSTTSNLIHPWKPSKKDTFCTEYYYIKLVVSEQNGIWGIKPYIGESASAIVVMQQTGILYHSFCEYVSSITTRSRSQMYNPHDITIPNTRTEQIQLKFKQPNVISRTFYT